MYVLSIWFVIIIECLRLNLLPSINILSWNLEKYHLLTRHCLCQLHLDVKFSRLVAKGHQLD